MLCLTKDEFASIILLSKFIYFKKATNFCKISTVDLSYVVMVKSMVEILQNFLTFSEYMNFITKVQKRGHCIYKLQNQNNPFR